MRAFVACVVACLALATSAWSATEVDARLGAGRIPVGGNVPLVVVVSDPKGNVADPVFDLPTGLELLGSARSQQFSWVNGRSQNTVQFRYEIGAERPGRYRVGPIRVSVGGVVYRSDELPLEVSDAGPSSPGRAPVAVGGGARDRSDVASLLVTLDPPQPVVGQLCRLRVQLVQRVEMAEDSEYQPPVTPGFWTESWGDPSRTLAREGRRDVAITETSLRLYPLAPGAATLSPAYAIVTPAGSGLLDPFAGLTSRRMEIRSDSLRVMVRPLPSGAPDGFDGAVGRFRLAWDLDRSHTTQDQTITARLDVRGVGNLPLLRAPAYAPSDFEVFAATVEDSLPPAGEISVGRRTFVWTLLPKRSGALRVPAPRFVWYDPERAAYDSGQPDGVALRVLAASGAAAADDPDALPSEVRRATAHPGSRAAWPWLALVAGFMVAGAVGLLRRSHAPDPRSAERARQREWLRGVGLAHGPDFWRAADESAAWLQARGDDVAWLRDAVQAARYGGRTEREDEVRRKLVERLAAAMPPAVSRTPLRIAAVLLAAAGLAAFVLAWPSSGPGDRDARAAAADALVAAGRSDRAEAEWARLWDEAPGDAALAARLAWAALHRGDVGVATVWAIQGDRHEARHPAMRLVSDRIRDAGGLVGAPGRALPLRSWEWAVVAFVCAVLVGVTWSRRPLAIGLLALAVVAGAWWPIESAWRSSRPLAVVRSATPLTPGDVRLEPGQVVTVLDRTVEPVGVRVTSDLEGTLPSSSLWFLETRP